MLEASALSNDGTYRSITLSDGTSANRIYFWFWNDSRLLIGLSSNSVVQIDHFESIDVTNSNKIAFKYKENDFSIWLNGIKIEEASLGNTPSGLNNINFADSNGVSFPFYSKTRELQYFDSALTDAQLETLTSWTSLQEMITSQLYTNY